MIKLTPPFTKADKEAIYIFGEQLMDSGRIVDDKLTGLSTEEKTALLLPGYDFNIREVEFSIARMNGELPDQIIGEDGEVLNVLYN